MEVQEYLDSIGIHHQVVKGDDANSYVVSLLDDNEFSKVFTILDKLDNKGEIELREDNQVVTEQGSSLLYISDEFQLNLLADFEGNIYQLVITKLE